MIYSPYMFSETVKKCVISFQWVTIVVLLYNLAFLFLLTFTKGYSTSVGIIFNLTQWTAAFFSQLHMRNCYN